MTEGGGASRSTDPASGTSSGTDVSLREFVTMQIGYERRGTMITIGAVAAFGAFAWSEIQRRLVNLNHENARILAAQDASVSADTYRGDEARRRGDQDRIEGSLALLTADVAKAATKEEVKAEGKVDRRAATGSTWQWIGGLIGVVVFVIVLWNFVAIHSNGSTPAVVCTATYHPAPCP